MQEYENGDVKVTLTSLDGIGSGRAIKKGLEILYKEYEKFYGLKWKPEK